MALRGSGPRHAAPPGTKVFSALPARSKLTGLVEVPMGMSLREIVFDVGGGVAGRPRRSRACRLGGPSGG